MESDPIDYLIDLPFLGKSGFAKRGGTAFCHLFQKLLLPYEY
jgi:hypothetical protein